MNENGTSDFVVGQYQSHFLESGSEGNYPNDCAIEISDPQKSKISFFNKVVKIILRHQYTVKNGSERLYIDFPPRQSVHHSSEKFFSKNDFLSFSTFSKVTFWDFLKVNLGLSFILVIIEGGVYEKLSDNFVLDVSHS